MSETIPPTANNIRAVAYNALVEARPPWMKLSDRVRVTDAVLAAADPMIRASERERIRHLAQQRLDLLGPENFSEAAATLADILIITHEGETT